jgi:hypothetical protein
VDRPSSGPLDVPGVTADLSEFRPASLPEDLQVQLDETTAQAMAFLQVRQFPKSFTLSRRIYERMLARQPSPGRFHKGTPLHNMGLARFWAGNDREGVQYTSLAFIEDALSVAAEQPADDEVFERPAAFNLLASRLFTADDLRDLARRTRDAVRRIGFFPDPRDLYKLLGLTKIIGRIPPGPKTEDRTPGQLEGPWSRRVFIGGAYSDIAMLKSFRDGAREVGWDAIFEGDFRVPKRLTHHHALMLLHECRAAVFEMSNEAGQLYEIERARDYMIKEVLVLYQVAPGFEKRLGTMTSGLVGYTGLKHHGYDKPEQGREAVKTWLNSLPKIRA